LLHTFDDQRKDATVEDEPRSPEPVRHLTRQPGRAVREVNHGVADVGGAEDSWLVLARPPIALIGGGLSRANEHPER
jgi:hypothetical protein